MEFREAWDQEPHQFRENRDCTPSAASSNLGNGRGKRSRRSSRRPLKVSFNFGTAGQGRAGAGWGSKESERFPVICFLKFIQLFDRTMAGSPTQCLIVSRMEVKLSIAGLERKISMRTSKEELIQRGILLPGEPGLNPGLRPDLPQDSRAASPRLNLPQLVVVNKSGKQHSPES